MNDYEKTIEVLQNRVRALEQLIQPVVGVRKWQPKREPLSDEIIAGLWGEEHSGKTDMVKNFAREIEKAHGIGVDDE